MGFNKILGKIALLNKGQDHIEEIPRVITTIYNIGQDIENDIVLDMHIQILKQGKRKMKIMLPVGWIHMRIDSGSELILDSNGITRIVIDNKSKKSTVCKRYGYIVNYLDSRKDVSTLQKISMIELIKFDKNQIMDIHIIAGESLVKLFKDNNNDLDRISDYVENILRDELNEIYPNWENPLAYWDLNDVRL